MRRCRPGKGYSKIRPCRTLAALIRAWRISQKCSEQALAERAGITASVLEALESEQADPPASTLEALAGALKIPLPWLFIHPYGFRPAV